MGNVRKYLYDLTPRKLGGYAPENVPNDIFDGMSVNEPGPESVAYTPSANIIGMNQPSIETFNKQQIERIKQHGINSFEPDESCPIKMKDGMRIIVTDDMNRESFSYEDFCKLTEEALNGRI